MRVTSVVMILAAPAVLVSAAMLLAANPQWPPWMTGFTFIAAIWAITGLVIGAWLLVSKSGDQ